MLFWPIKSSDIAEIQMVITSGELSDKNRSNQERGSGDRPASYVCRLYVPSIVYCFINFIFKHSCIQTTLNNLYKMLLDTTCIQGEILGRKVLMNMCPKMSGFQTTRCQRFLETKRYTKTFRETKS